MKKSVDPVEKFHVGKKIDYKCKDFAICDEVITISILFFNNVVRAGLNDVMTVGSISRQS